MKALAVALLVAVFSGCAVHHRPQSVFELTEGSLLNLTVPLTVPPNQARVAIRNAGPVWPTAARYAPNCSVEVEQPMARSQTIMPGEFRVGRTYQHEDHMSCGNHIFATTMYLRSEDQPFVRAVTCQIWDDYASGSFLTARQMEQTLSTVFEIP